MKSAVGMECWINDCARPRVDEVCCAVHGGVEVSEEVVTVVVAPLPRKERGRAQEEVLALLVSRGPLRVFEVAEAFAVTYSSAYNAVLRLVGAGRARRCSWGVYEAVPA